MDIALLARDLTDAVSTLGPEQAAVHGFGLLIEGPDVPAGRRAHARTVLLAEHTLQHVVELAVDRVVLMKGLEVAQLYPTPVARPFRDVDVLVTDPTSLWDTCVEYGYRQHPDRRADIDHHHLPALASPYGRIGVEVHLRPNTPGWASIDPAWVIRTAQPSRTGIDGAYRPRDDIHALIMALHAWKGGFTRLRDVYDAVLLAASSETPVEETAAQLGLGPCWKWTMRFAETQLLDRGGVAPRAVAAMLLPRHAGLQDRRRVRLIAPFLVANPVRVARGHLAEYRLGREARRHVDGPPLVSTP